MQIYITPSKYEIKSYGIQTPNTDSGEMSLWANLEIHTHCDEPDYIVPVLHIKNLLLGTNEYVATTAPRYYFFIKGKWILDINFCYNRMIYDSMPAEATFYRSRCESLEGKTELEVLKILSESKFPEDCNGNYIN